MIKLFSKEKIIGLLPEVVRKQFTQKNSDRAIMRNIAYLTSGTAGAQALGFLLTPIVTRIYSPDSFGVLAIFATVLSLIVPLVTFRYSVAIPLPSNSGLAFNLVSLCLGITLGVSLIAGTIFWLFGDWIFTLLSMPELSPYWWLLVLGILGTGLYETFSSWAIREKAFKILARTKVNQAVSGNLVKIGLGLLALKSMGLFVGHVVKQAAGTTTIFWKARKELLDGIKYVTIDRIKFLMKYYSTFPKYQIGSRFLLAFAMKAPLLFMVNLFDSGVTGQLSLSMTVLAIPMSLVGSSVGKAYFAEIAAIGPKKPHKIQKITRKITKKLFLVSIVPFFVLLLGGPWLFSILFGENWTQAGWFASALSISLLAQFVAGPIVNTLSVYRMEDYYLKLNLLRIGVLLFVFGTAYIYNFSAFNTILMYSIFLTIFYLFVYWLIMKVANDKL